MKIGKVLLGYDGSASAGHALEFAVLLAQHFDAELHVVAVARPPDIGDDVETRAVLENSRRHYEKLLEPLRGRLAAERLKVEYSIVVGHPAEQLVRYAEAHGIDHIVVGRRGHTVFERFLLGSVARQVMAYAHCAVTVVKT
jgi:nucleotide-binding universal stress UspA family protein